MIIPSKFRIEADRFKKCATNEASVEYSEKGVEQFYCYESTGQIPEFPDPFFNLLVNGKKWWEWTLNFIKDTYLTEKWSGWYMYAKDFKNDPNGFKQLRQRCGESPITPDEYFSQYEKLKGSFL